MNDSEASNEIAKFWSAKSPFQNKDASHEIARIEEQLGESLPASAIDYMRDACPVAPLFLQSIGNPIHLYSLSQLSGKQVGYSHFITGEPIEGWSPSWFLIGDEGADPIIIDLNSKNKRQVKISSHGMGHWEFEPAADSPGQFLLCATAIHHALTAWGMDVVLEADDGFRLADQPAQWLFPHLKVWAGPYYEHWCSFFSNC